MLEAPRELSLRDKLKILTGLYLEEVITLEQYMNHPLHEEHRQKLRGALESLARRKSIKARIIDRNG